MGFNSAFKGLTYPEDGSTRFLLKSDKFLPEYSASHLSRSYSSQSWHAILPITLCQYRH